MHAILRYTLLTAIRDKLFLGVLLMLTLAIGLSLFVGSTSLVEQQQMAASFMAATTRLVLQAGMVIFTCFHGRRLFEHREIELMLASPIARSSFVLWYWISLVMLAILLIIPLTLLIGIFLQNFSGSFPFWIVSLTLETAILIAFAMLASLLLQSGVAAVLASGGYYILSRLMGFFTATLDSQLGVYQFEWVRNVMEWVLKAISVILPRFDLFTNSRWLIYGIERFDLYYLIPLQAIVYIPLILAVAVYDVKNKQF